MKSRTKTIIPLLGLICVAIFAGKGMSQTTGVTYQGKLNDGTAAANANYDFEFRLYDAAAGGTQIGSTAVRNNVAVAAGIFAVNLDFGTGFPGADRFLEIAVRQAGGGGFTILSPRQRINSAPYSIKSISSETATTAATATTANNALQLGGVAANQYVQTADPRLSDARIPLAGSSNYVQNTTSPQAATNFNITGNGTAGGTLSANIVNSLRYDMGGFRIVSTPGTGNLFVGISAGTTTITGSDSSFFGAGAGELVTNATSDNSFFGRNAGRRTATSRNSFFGSKAGMANQLGIGNSFFGESAGVASSSGTLNTFVGSLAGAVNISGDGNTIIGASNSGGTNTSGSNNTLLGNGADVSVGNLDHATAIGAGSVVVASNTIALGRSSGADRVRVYGPLGLNDLDAATSLHLCFNTTTNNVANCTSSIRYKKNVEPLQRGMDLIKQFRPVIYNWKDSDQPDLGLIAEDVARIEPLLITRDNTGEVLGVKYDQLTVILINAAKEHQKEIEILQAQVRLLKVLACKSNKQAAVCKEK